MQHTSAKVDSVVGHPDYTRMNWAKFDRQLNDYLIRRGLISPTEKKLRGMALRRTKNIQNRS